MVTIKDVAREAGVSVASVSRALNGHGGVTAQTQARIREVATRLRYVPHVAARSLITRRTHTVGTLLPDLHGEFFSELIRGIDLAARARGQHLLVSSSHDDTAEVAAVLQAMQGRVDGLLVMLPQVDTAFLQQNLPIGLPVVLMNTAHDTPEHASLEVDNYGGASRMMQHLLDIGRRRIAFVQGPAGNRDVAERERAYRDALVRRLPGAEPIVLPGDFSEASGYAAGERLRRLDPLPDAVFAANDMMAIGCMAALREAGLRIPEDVALAGFDDVQMTRYVTPALTTVRVHIAQLGSDALALLDAQVDGQLAPAERHRQIPTELVVRASTRGTDHAGADRR
ncbi:LacI family DNA-binding transcriptional regulator [Frateuria defendens]|uniref:LacI family DNA-binding transcriptional regulator n=1 Tax=Frateuria defendens TaxID=2219559 RepID=UPI00066FDBDF|nr:LacI family DNA-binding transcriptional regulator [Frateuria defendens]